jgi:hypothetical protein
MGIEEARQELIDAGVIGKDEQGDDNSTPETNDQDTDDIQDGIDDADVDIPGEDDTSGEQEVEEEEQQDSGTAEAVPALDYDLLMEAGRMGMSKEQALAFGSNEGLRAALDYVQSQKPQEEQEEAPEEEAPKGFSFDLPEDEYDEKLVGQLNGFAEHMQAQLSKITEVLSTSQQGYDLIREQAEQKRAYEMETQFDSTLDGIDGYGKLFGKAPEKGTPEFKAREKVWKELSILVQADRLAGRETSIGELTKDAIMKTYPEKFQEQVKKSILDKLKKRKSAMGEKPSSGEEHESEDERAISRLSKMYAQRGMSAY